MYISKEFILYCFGVLSFVIFLTSTQLFFRKEKNASEAEGKFVLAYGLLFLSWIFSFAILNYKTLYVLVEFSDTLYKVKRVSPETDLLTTGFLFIGISVFWMFFCYLIANTLSFLSFGRRTSLNEIKSDNYVYFIIKGSVFVGLTSTLLPIYELILRMFLPEIEIPFYR